MKYKYTTLDEWRRAARLIGCTVQVGQWTRSGNPVLLHARDRDGSLRGTYRATGTGTLEMPETVISEEGRERSLATER